MSNYDKWKTDTPDNHLKYVTDCCCCWEWIHEGDTAIEVEEGFLHEDCLDDWVKDVVVKRTIEDFGLEDL